MFSGFGVMFYMALHHVENTAPYYGYLIVWAMLIIANTIDENLTLNYNDPTADILVGENTHVAKIYQRITKLNEIPCKVSAKYNKFTAAIKDAQVSYDTAGPQERRAFAIVIEQCVFDLNESLTAHEKYEKEAEQEQKKLENQLNKLGYNPETDLVRAESLLAQYNVTNPDTVESSKPS